MGERVETSIRRKQQSTWPLLASHPHLLLVMLVDIVVLIEHLELECLVTQTCCDTPMDGVSYTLLPWRVLHVCFVSLGGLMAMMLVRVNG